MQNVILKKLKNLFAYQLVEEKLKEIKILLDNLDLTIYNLNKNLIYCRLKRLQLKNLIVRYEKKRKSTHKSIIDKIDYLNKNPTEISSEYKKLEIDLYYKKIKDLEFKIITNKEEFHTIELIYNSKRKYYLENKDNFVKVISKYEKQINYLLQKYFLLIKRIEPNLFNLYKKIRNRYQNRLAVVPVAHCIAFGEFFVIPSKVCDYLYKRKYIILDEYSGRILIDYNLAKYVITNILPF
jgi:predicted  nucleic acid-binding Zn-ribbon protein